MEKFTPELRADLQEVYGVNLADLFNEKRWVHLLALIDGLQQGSRYLAAVALDPEIAEQMVNHDEYASQRAEDSGPSLVGYDHLNQQMAMLIDAVHANTAATVASAGGKSKPPKPLPRPKTAIDKAKEDRSKTDQKTLISEFTST